MCNISCAVTNSKKMFLRRSEGEIRSLAHSVSSSAISHESDMAKDNAKIGSKKKFVKTMHKQNCSSIEIEIWLGSNIARFLKICVLAQMKLANNGEKPRFLVGLDDLQKNNVSFVLLYKQKKNPSA